MIMRKMRPSFVETLPVRKFHGIGPATARKMARLGIETGLDVKGQPLEFLQHHFGKAGSYYYWRAPSSSPPWSVLLSSSSRSS